MPVNDARGGTAAGSSAEGPAAATGEAALAGGATPGGGAGEAAGEAAGAAVDHGEGTPHRGTRRAAPRGWHLRDSSLSRSGRSRERVPRAEVRAASWRAEGRQQRWCRSRGCALCDPRYATRITRGETSAADRGARR